MPGTAFFLPVSDVLSRLPAVLPAEHVQQGDSGRFIVRQPLLGRLPGALVRPFPGGVPFPAPVRNHAFRVPVPESLRGSFVITNVQGNSSGTGAVTDVLPCTWNQRLTTSAVRITFVYST